MRYDRFSIIGFMFVILLGCQTEEHHSSAAATGMPTELLVVSRDSLETNRKPGLVYQRNKPFTGVSISHYGNGQIAEKISFLNGQRNGKRQKWFESGLLSYQASYLEGFLDGKVKSWWQNGKLRSLSNYDHGVADGEQKEWYSSGKLFKSMQLVNGLEEGIQQAWRENGKLYVNYEAKNGRIFGLKRASLCYELTNENIVLND